MTFTDFWRAYGGGILTLTSSLVAFVIWLRVSISRLEGRVGILEDASEEQSSCIATLNAREVDNRLREYKASETDKQLSGLSEQIVKGFAQLNGTINAMNIQNVHILEQLSSQQKALDEMRRKVDRHEKIIHLSGLPGKDTPEDWDE